MPSLIMKFGKYGSFGVRDYVDWVLTKALPVWATLGHDKATGRFRERLDLEGRPLAVPHRAMVQARQIYVYAHAAKAGWFDDGAALAERAMDLLRRDFARESDGTVSFAFSIDAHARTVVSTTRDAYTHAFILFAIAQLHALNGDPALLDLADRTITFVDRHLHDETHGGLRETFPSTQSHKRQNPQMHLLEAYLSLHAAAPNRGYDERAIKLVELFREKLFCRRRNILIEHFSELWGDHPDEVMGSVFEPGHHYEWIWLLDQHQQASGENMREWRQALASATGSHGHAPSGLIYDEVLADGTVVKASHRLWPHTEAIKAAAVHHAEGDRLALPFARRMARVLSEHFLDKPFPGGWTDQIGQDGAPIVDYVPASSLYHLFLAAAEADAAFKTEVMADRAVPQVDPRVAPT